MFMLLISLQTSFISLITYTIFFGHRLQQMFAITTAFLNYEILMS